MIDFTAAITDLDGKIITEPENANGQMQLVNVTLSRIAVNAVLGTFPDDSNISGEEKLRRFLLAQKILNAKNELAAEDVAFLKDRIGRAYGPLIVGRAYALLDPANAVPAPKAAAPAGRPDADLRRQRRSRLGR